MLSYALLSLHKHMHVSTRMPIWLHAHLHERARAHKHTRTLTHMQAHEAMRRAKFKFPGRQKIITSNKWGFTAFARDDFLQYRAEGRLQNDGVHCNLITNQ